MAEPTVIQANIPEHLHDAFREVLCNVPKQPNIGALVAYCFNAGARAEREQAIGRALDATAGVLASEGGQPK
jgi:hypothetical protein